LILPFDRAQGAESFDSAQDREPVERLVEPFAICYLLFGIFYFKRSTMLDIVLDFLNISVGFNTIHRWNASGRRPVLDSVLQDCGRTACGLQP